MICISNVRTPPWMSNPVFFEGSSAAHFQAVPAGLSTTTASTNNIAWPHSQDELHPRDCRCVLSPPRPNRSKPPQKTAANESNGIDAAAAAGRHRSWGVNLLPFLAFSRKPHFTFAAGGGQARAGHGCRYSRRTRYEYESAVN